MTEHASEPKQQQPSGGLKRISEARARINNAWFPANPQLLKKIRTGFETGLYQGDLDFLLRELKSDAALFTYCLKELIKLLRAKDPDFVCPANPVDLFRQAALDELRSIVSVKESDISAHRLQDLTGEQAQQMQQILISSTVAESICEGASLDPELGFVCALMRQLGLTLIAWNYPHIFQRLCCARRQGQTIDESISKMLGFSPTLLGVTIAREWGLSPEIRCALNDPRAIEEQEIRNREAVERGSQLAKICRIGEALARASAPEDYPSAKEDWEYARLEIQRVLGAEGFEFLQERVFGACENYINFAPHIFTLPKWEPAAPSHASETGLQLMSRNGHMERCPARLRGAMRQLYTAIDVNAISKDNIMALTRDVIPLAGFPSGCIYLIEPDTNTLVPRLAIGTAKLGAYRALPAGGSSDFHPILTAYRSNAPIMEHNVQMDYRTVSYIAGAIGTVQRSGVLFVEIAECLLGQYGANPLTRFKAIRQLLCDCLNLY